MFTPPFCPHPDCSQHTDPKPRFFRPHGSYRAKCRPWRIPRYACRTCRRTFSRQTFRMDYRDHRPDTSTPGSSRCSPRASGCARPSRTLGLSLRCTELKFRKIARHLRRLNLSLRDQLEDVARFHFDELESYEGQRNAPPFEHSGADREREPLHRLG